MHKVLLICLTPLLVVLNAAGQERADYVTAERVQRDVTFLLLDKNIGGRSVLDVSTQKPNSVKIR